MKSASGRFLLPATFQLQCGRKLPDATLAWHTYGELNDKADNAILVCPALTGSQSLASGDGARDGWWKDIVGSGKTIDTDKFFVIGINNLGGCDGSTGPADTNPDTGQPWGEAFPAVTVSDWVSSQALLADDFGISQLHAVVGGSLGGMQAAQWAVQYPDRLKKCGVLAATATLSAQNIAFNFIARRCIAMDIVAAGQDGDDATMGEAMSEATSNGMELARMIGHMTYLSEEGVNKRFGRRMQEDSGPSPFAVESYLQHLASSFVKTGFDPHTYLLMTRVLDNFDLAAGGDLTKALHAVQAQLLVVSFRSDWRFPPERSQELVSAAMRARKAVSYLNIEADKGHDSFLFPIERYTKALKTFLQEH